MHDAQDRGPAHRERRHLAALAVPWPDTEGHPPQTCTTIAQEPCQQFRCQIEHRPWVNAASSILAWEAAKRVPETAVHLIDLELHMWRVHDTDARVIEVLVEGPSACVRFPVEGLGLGEHVI